MIPIALKLNRPLVAQFLTDWTKSNENRTFDFTNESDKEDFVKAMTELAQMISQTYRSSEAALIIGDSGVKTVYLRVQ